MLNTNNSATVINNARTQYYTCHFITLIFAFFSICVCMVEHEIYLDHSFVRHNTYRFYLLWVHYFINFLLSLNIILSYSLYLTLLKKEHRLYASDGFIITGLWKSVIWEICVNWISPCPFLYQSQYHDLYDGVASKIKTYANTPLIVLCLLIRSYHILMVILEASAYMNSRAFRVWKSVGTNASYSFALRCIFREYSMHMVLFCVLYFTFLFGYMFRIAELPIHHLQPGDHQFTWTNSMWVAIVSMTTVGYGDISPHSGTGSYTGLVCSFFGIQLTAFFLISIAQFLSMSSSETFSYELRENVEETESIKQKAIAHIVSYYKLHHRGTKRAKELFRHTHSNTCSWVNICRWKWVERMTYQYHFGDFKRSNRNHRLVKVQSITEMDMNRKSVIEIDRGKSPIYNLS